MAQQHRQAYEVALVVGQVLVSHRVAKQVRVDLHSDDREVLVAKRLASLI